MHAPKHIGRKCSSVPLLQRWLSQTKIKTKKWMNEDTIQNTIGYNYVAVLSSQLYSVNDDHDIKERYSRQNKWHALWLPLAIVGINESMWLSGKFAIEMTALWQLCLWHISIRCLLFTVWDKNVVWHTMYITCFIIYPWTLV